MKILCVDTEPSWRAACCDWGYDAANDVIPGYDLYIISARLIDKVDALPANFVVATARKTTQEAIKSFRLGAEEYFTKNLDIKPY